ncbi:phenylacetate--CoA ligase family protein [Algoriphagus sp. PAP.12]|uniref:phenylacetate--CoA ligase family protein n=1 Tax=Algoriphagus sp. PAP.12 TaxID=2996678 RepID=UPI00227C800B|nr:phenylacetate--CoA ligase family protein [Algoriphagus sp. PAP.12]
MISVVELLKFRKYPIESAQKELERIQSFSLDQFESWKEKKKWETVRFHFENNPTYQKIVGKYLPGRWEDLPIIRKKDIQGDFKEIVSHGFDKSNLHFGSTSGSSGIPLKFAKDKFCHSMTWALILDRYKKVNLAPSDLQARFYGIPLGFPSYQKERIKDKFMNRYRFVVFDLSDESLDRFLETFKKKKFIYVYGYTNTQLFFAKYLERKNIVLKDVCPSLKGGIVTGEQCSEENRAILEKQFGIPMFNEYGASEVEFLAMSDLTGKRWLSSETVVSEVLDSNNLSVQEGGSGSLVFTNMFNKAMPFIRYEVGDIGAISQVKDSIQEELLELNGRLNQLVLLPSGKKAAGFSLYYISKYLMANLKGLQEYQVRQLELDTFELDLVIDGPLAPNANQVVQEAFDKYLEKGLKIKVSKLDQIDREKSGKLKHFISHLRKD